MRSNFDFFSISVQSEAFGTDRKMSAVYQQFKGQKPLTERRLPKNGETGRP
jgi:hypothetical protein